MRRKSWFMSRNFHINEDGVQNQKTRHSGVGRNPGSYQIPAKWGNPRSTALSATRSYMTNWIPASAGMADACHELSKDQ